MNLGYLNIKSGYTFLKSSLKIDDIVKVGKDNNLPFLALTDYNNMFGAMEFYHKCKDANIKPILGIETKLDIDETSIVLIATSNQGYLSLCKLTSYISTQDLNSYVTLEQLEECKNGLVCIVPYIRSNLSNLDFEHKKERIDKIKNIFTAFYLGLECYKDDTSILKEQRKFAIDNKLNTIPCLEVLTTDYSSTYLLDILKAIKLNTSISQLETVDYKNKHFINEGLANRIFSEDEIKTSNQIANLIEYHLEDIKGDLVKYPLKDGVDEFDYLYALARKGLDKRLAGKVTTNYIDRLNYELKIIKQMNFVNYFLVVYDYIKFAKQNDIAVGPGRGSGAGSLVCYALGITNIDPIINGLLFERFLNPERVTMPDIDTDFMDIRRDEVIQYLIDKYGSDNIARVISFQTFKSKSAIRDVAKAIGCSLAEAKELSKALPNEKEDEKKTLEELANSSPTFLSLVKTNDTFKRVYQISLLIEDLPRQTSMHAAGVVCSNVPLCSICPTYKTNVGMTLTQYDGNYIEEFNLYKMDLLGLTNLTIIKEIVDEINSKENVNLDINNIDLKDPNIYKVLQKGYYCGIFQMDQNSIKSAAKKLRPENLDDVTVALAIGRPATMSLVDTYCKRRHGKEKVFYPLKQLEPVVKETYGIILYQEQVMRALQVLAGFSLGKADLVRRAISKKNQDKLLASKEDFINGCLKNNISKEKAIETFELIEKFGGYGFNKSHSMVYAVISSQMCYLKYYYPIYFYKSILNTLGKDSKIEQYYFEMAKQKIFLVKPSINKSTNEFKVDHNNILFSLTKIAGITPATSKTILAEREKGYFTSFVDFVQRTNLLGIGKEELFSLIYAGCFDEFEYNRTTLINNIDTVLMFASLSTKLTEDNEVIINNLVDKPNFIVYEDNELEILEKEKQVLGIYLSSSPLSKDREKFANAGFITINEISGDIRSAKIVSKIDHIKVIRTKNGDQMAFVDLSDETGTISATIFPNEYEKFKDILNVNDYIQVVGSIEERNEDLNLIVKNMKTYKIK